MVGQAHTHCGKMWWQYSTLQTETPPCSKTDISTWITLLSGDRDTRRNCVVTSLLLPVGSVTRTSLFLDPTQPHTYTTNSAWRVDSLWKKNPPKSVQLPLYRHDTKITSLYNSDTCRSAIRKRQVMTNTGYTQKNGAVSKVNKKFISHLTRAQRTPSAAATVKVSHALPAVRFSC